MISLGQAIREKQIVIRKELIEGKLELEKFGLAYNSFLDRFSNNKFDVDEFFERTYFTQNIQNMIKSNF